MIERRDCILVDGFPVIVTLHISNDTDETEYTLVDGVISRTTRRIHAGWLEEYSPSTTRIIRKDQIGKFEIVTLFLIGALQFPSSPPYLFRTMVLHPEMDKLEGRQHRFSFPYWPLYKNTEEASRGHDIVCNSILTSHPIL